MTQRHVVVLGGSGFVGLNVCQHALKRHWTVSSVSRSGRPHFGSGSCWADDVRWIRHDLLSSSSSSQDELVSLFKGVDAVVSCVGGFGSIEHMKRVNGSATINAINTAQKAGVERFGFVSVHHYELPQNLKRGYMEGKMAAEKELTRLFGHKRGVIVRPGFIYGVRNVKIGNQHVGVPLNVIGVPLAMLSRVTRPLLSLPLLGPLLTPLLLPPVHVEAVAACLLDELFAPNAAGVQSFSVDEIMRHGPK